VRREWNGYGAGLQFRLARGALDGQLLAGLRHGAYRPEADILFKTCDD